MRMPLTAVLALLLLGLPAAGQPPHEEELPEVPPEAVEEELPTETVAPPPEVVAVEPSEEPPLVTGAVSGPRGPVVEAIEVRSDAPLGGEGGRRELRQLITIPVGEPLTERAVRRTLRNLQATGAAYEVELYTRPVGPPPPPGEEPERAVVVLVIRAAVQVKDVAIEGRLGLDRSNLRNRLLIHAGQPLIESRLIRSVYRLQDLYEDRGWFGATVRLEVDVDEAAKDARVVFRVDAGERAEIGAVRFDGATGQFTREQLLEQLEAEPGKPYRRSTLNDDTDRLQRWLVEQGYRRAQVDPPREEVEADGSRVDLVYPLRVGPRVEVEIVGAPRKELVKRDLLPFLGEQGYDEALVIQAVGRVEEYYQEKGHWQVEVEWEEERTEDLLRLVFRVEKGPQYTLEELRFEGNEEVSDESLAELMETTPQRFLALGSGNLVTSVLEEDLDNIRAYYALQGYVGYEVGPPRTLVEGRDVRLTIPIEEGQRRQVVDLSFSGVQNLDLDRLREEIPLDAGGPYHPVLVEDSVRILRGLYEEAGYPGAQVSAREDWSADRTLVDVSFDVIEGLRTSVDRVIVRGNLRTRDRVIEEAIEIEPGEPVSRARLLDVERRLYGLGIFSRVDVDLGPADLSEQTRDVVVRVEEGRTQRLTYGVGFDSDDGFAVLLGYGHRNLWGRAVSFQSDLRAGQNESFARALLDQPSVTDWDLRLLYSIATEEEDLESYDVDRVVSRVEAVHVTDEWRYGLALDYRIIDSRLDEGVQAGSPLEVVERRDQDISISSLIPNALLDRRNDPIEPTDGWSASARLQWAFQIADLTDAHFVKPFVQVTGYRELGWGYLAGSARAALIEPLADATLDVVVPPGEERGEEPDNLKIPIDERLFAGGNFSHRAYRRDELGIPGETLFPDGEGRGGAGLVLLNLDYRFPLWGPVGGVAFYDTGNVWPEWEDVDLSGLKGGVGLAARYVSPIGPIRAGVAYKLDPEPDEDEWRLYLALGNPF